MRRLFSSIAALVTLLIGVTTSPAVAQQAARGRITGHAADTTHRARPTPPRPSGRPAPRRKPSGRSPTGLQATGSCVEECGGGGGGGAPADTFAVKVLGTGGGGTIMPYSAGLTATFQVQNTGNVSDSYNLSCSTTDSVVCRSLSTNFVTLAPSEVASVTATYDLRGLASAQWVQLSASGQNDPPAQSSAQRAITIAAPAGAPVLSLAPHNGGYRSVGMCTAACFDEIATHSTPAYFTLGVARAFTLSYNSSTAAPVPTISLDVNAPSGYTPTAFRFQAVRADNGTVLKFVNDSSKLYYAASGTQVNRVVLPIPAGSNNLSTGAYPVLVTVTSMAGSDSTKSNTVKAVLLVVNQANSPFGAGVDAPGLQHLYTGADGSVMFTEGDGSAAFYQYTPANGYAIPGGSSAYFNGATRTYLDGSTVTFNGSGQMTQTVDKYGNVTAYTYTGSLLTRITDPKGKMIVLQYDGNNKLQTVFDSAGGSPRRTTYMVTGGNLVKITDPDSLFTQFGYDANRRLTSITDRAGQVSNLTYDALGRLSQGQGPDFIVWYPTGMQPNPLPHARVTASQIGAESKVWNASGVGTSVGSAKGATAKDSAYATLTSQLGAVTRVTMDRFGGAMRTVNPLGAISTATRDSMGRILTAQTPRGQLVVNSWTPSGSHPQSLPYTSPYLLWQSTTTTGSQVQTTTYDYDLNLNLKQVSGGGETRYYTYSGHHLVTEAVAGLVLRTHYFLANGLDTAVVDNASHRTQWAYDTARGNLITTVDARGATFRSGRDLYGRDTSATAPMVATSYTFYDKLNRVIRTRDPYAQEILTTYDPLGRVVRVRDKKGQVNRFAYGPNGVTIQYDLADTLHAETYGYDMHGLMVDHRTRLNQDIALSYDLLGRLRSRSGPDFPVDSFAYDAMGAWVTVWNANGRDSVALDQGGQVVHESQWFGTQRWGFDFSYGVTRNLLSRLPTSGTASATAGIGSYTLSYNGFGTLQQVTGAGAAASISLNSEGLVSTLTYSPNGTPWTQSATYDRNHADSTRAFSASGLNGLLGGTLLHDSLGRLTTQGYNGGQAPTRRQFTYDSLGQLVNTCDYRTDPNTCLDEFGRTPSATVVSYRYDAAGNRVVNTESFNNVGPGNRLITTRGWYFTYDSAGNALTKCTSATGCVDGFRYSWNSLGQLTEVRDEASVLVASFKYDPFGRRVEKRTPTGVLRFVYDGDQILADVDTLGAVKTEYSYWPGQTDRLLGVKSTVGSWSAVAIADPGVGSIQALAASSNGSILKQYDTDPWGRNTTSESGTPTRYRLAGREYDVETGLYYNRARYYDPDAGRFISEDPIGIAGGLNRYAYAAGDPVNSRDPSGTDQDCWISHGIAAVWIEDQQGRVIAAHFEPNDVEYCTAVAPPPSTGKTGGGGGRAGSDQSQTAIYIACAAAPALVMANVAADLEQTRVWAGAGADVARGTGYLLRGLVGSIGTVQRQALGQLGAGAARELLTSYDATIAAGGLTIVPAISQVGADVTASAQGSVIQATLDGKESFNPAELLPGAGTASAINTLAACKAGGL